MNKVLLLPHTLQNGFNYSECQTKRWLSSVQTMQTPNFEVVHIVILKIAILLIGLLLEHSQRILITARKWYSNPFTLEVDLQM